MPRRLSSILTVVLTAVLLLTSGAALAFSPKATLKGKRVKPEGTSASFTVPENWKHGWTKYEGKDVYSLKPDGRDAAIVMSRHALSADDQQLSAKELLAAGVDELLGGAQVETVAGPDAFELERRAAARIVMRATVQGQKLEAYVAAIKIDDWAFSIVALYKQSDSDHIRAGIETVLASFKANPPKQNKKLRRLLVGCWEDYTSNSSGSGSGQSQVKLRINADGTWTRHYWMSVSAGGMTSSDEKKSHGTWTVFGSELNLDADKGKSLRYGVKLKGGILYLNGTKYLPCN